MRLLLVVLVSALGASAWAGPPKKKGATPPAAAPAPAPKKGAPSLPANLPGPAPAEAQAPAEGAPPPSRGPTRIDFDDRLIQGQTNKSGAVYLYDRKELKIRSMIKKRESFRDEIVGSLFDQ